MRWRVLVDGKGNCEETHSQAARVCIRKALPRGTVSRLYGQSVEKSVEIRRDLTLYTTCHLMRYLPPRIDIWIEGGKKILQIDEEGKAACPGTTRDKVNEVG